MPSKINPQYHPPKVLFNRHLETIYPALFRKLPMKLFPEIEIDTDDDDFLQLDWYREMNEPNNKVVIISHGLEGDSRRPYILGMVNHFTKNQWDAIAWNYRGCGSKMNRQKIFYHSGATYDLESVVRFAAKHYKNIFLAGFSLGGNLTLKYLGENPHAHVAGGCVFSVPLDLEKCSLEMEKRHNYIYSLRFLLKLKAKINAKKEKLKYLYSFKRLNKITTLYDFDEHFTAPLHGFLNASDYYRKCSSLFFLDLIKKPVLLINAKNDPFLTPECYPHDLADKHQFLYFEETSRGGHVGFTSFQNGNIFWSEKRAVEFAIGLTKE